VSMWPWCLLLARPGLFYKDFMYIMSHLEYAFPVSIFVCTTLLSFFLIAFLVTWNVNGKKCYTCDGWVGDGMLQGKGKGGGV
jgi:hypothetical protein